MNKEHFLANAHNWIFIINREDKTDEIYGFTNGKIFKTERIVPFLNDIYEFQNFLDYHMDFMKIRYRHINDEELSYKLEFYHPGDKLEKELFFYEISKKDREAFLTHLVFDLAENLNEAKEELIEYEDEQ
jgi:hypothetical protein